VLFHIWIVQPAKLLEFFFVEQRQRVFVCNFELLRHKGSEDASVGRRIFVAHLFERVEALAAALVVQLVESVA
jgi:hypothetical protein